MSRAFPGWGLNGYRDNPHFVRIAQRANYLCFMPTVLSFLRFRFRHKKCCWQKRGDI